MYVLLFLFWLLLNGKITAEIVILGLVISIAMAALEQALFGYTLKKELRVIRKIPIFLAYAFVLVWEILKAGYTVSTDILLKKRKVTPSLVSFQTDLKTGFGRFILANSITLTPGTITIRVEGNRLTVHCLDKSMLDTSENGVFQRWIRRLED